DGMVRSPEVRVHATPLEGDEGDEASAVARYFDFPLGIRGLHSTELTFARPGEWLLTIEIPRDGNAVETSFAIDVAERTVAPAIGDPAPPSQHRTLADVAGIEELTTSYEPDPA